MANNTKSITGARQKSLARSGQTQQAPRSRTTAIIAPVLKRGKHAPRKAELAHQPGSQEAITTNFILYANPTLALVCVPTDAPVLFSIADASNLTGVHADMLRYYSRAGLIETSRGVVGPDLTFDENAIDEVRRIEHYRRNLGVGRLALPLLCELQREGERRHIELHFLRYRQPA